MKMTIPWAVVIVAVIAGALFATSLWQDRYYFQSIGQHHEGVIRVNKWTGKAEMSLAGGEWKAKK